MRVERAQSQVYIVTKLLFFPFKIIKSVLFILAPRWFSYVSPEHVSIYLSRFKYKEHTKERQKRMDLWIAWSVTFWTCMNAVVIHISLDELRGSSVSAELVVLSNRRNRALIVIDAFDKLYSILYIIICSLSYYILLRSIVIVHYDDTLIIVTIINCYIVKLCYS